MQTRDQILTGRIPRRATQIRPGTSTAFPLSEGEFIQITDVSGKQVATFLAFNPHDIKEYLSTGHTRAGNNSMMLIQGMNLFSNRYQSLLTLVEDTCGRHDILLPACDPNRFMADYGIEEHDNCRDTLFDSLQRFGVEYDYVPDSVNFFMNVGLRTRGEFEIREPISERNDYVLLRALTDLVVAVASCPQDQNASNAFRPSDIQIKVYS